jgi:hypothetical protein
MPSANSEGLCLSTFLLIMVHLVNGLVPYSCKATQCEFGNYEMAWPHLGLAQTSKTTLPSVQQNLYDQHHHDCLETFNRRHTGGAYRLCKQIGQPEARIWSCEEDNQKPREYNEKLVNSCQES